MKINNILVCLDLSPLDTKLVSYVAYLQRTLGQPMGVTLFHNIRYDFLSAHPEFDESKVNNLCRRVAKDLAKKFGHLKEQEGVSLKITVEAKNRTEEAILALKRQERFDWLVMGKKNENASSGILPLRILAADEKETPMLLLPSDENQGEFHRIEVGLDLTKAADKFLARVADLAEALGSSWHAVHVYQAPAAYFPYIEQANDAIQKDIRERAQKRLDELWRKQKPDVEGTVDLVRGPDIARRLLDKSVADAADLLVIKRISKPGLMGHRLGGVARHMLSLDVDLPLLIL
mgnify:CR=1 FL=1